MQKNYFVGQKGTNVMPVKTTVDVEKLKHLAWLAKSNLNKVNEAAGLGSGTVYKLEGRNVTLDTIDSLHNALERMLSAVGTPPPDDLWDQLLVHEEVEDE